MHVTESAQTPSEVSEPAQSPVVVVADDDQAIRSFFRRALERAGFTVLLATNGRRAIELAGSNPVDALVLDLNMPGLSGLETLREIRADAALRTLPVIMVTGSLDEADHVAGLEHGADDVIIKPVSLAQLVARVRTQIRGHAAMVDEAKAGREHRRRLAAVLSELPREGDLVTLGAELAARLPSAVGVDGVAILAFGRNVTRCIAATAALQHQFPPGRPLPHDVGADLAHRAAAGPWLQAAASGASGEKAELAFVPFGFTPASAPIGCLVFARTDPSAYPLANRLADMIDTTEFAVTALRPAIESAETTNTAILELRQLIGRRRFAVHLQPICRLDSRAVFGYEALTRFDDGVRPDARFAEAGRLGLGRLLERATITAAIDAVAPLPAGPAISVNISPDVLEHERALPDILSRAGRPVIIELTEHERIDDYDAIRAAFARLGSTIRLAVDDAGSGYASLKHILSLQPSFVKLDMEWVRDIHRDPVRRSLVSGLAYFADETGSELIAEGIETEPELDALIALGVRLGQGFLLGRPVPVEALAD